MLHESLLVLGKILDLFNVDEHYYSHSGMILFTRALSLILVPCPDLYG